MRLSEKGDGYQKGEDVFKGGICTLCTVDKWNHSNLKVWPSCSLV